ncbi:MAG: hypothetical protein AAF624_04985 [Bacteroidota bacterium]
MNRSRHACPGSWAEVRWLVSRRWVLSVALLFLPLAAQAQSVSLQVIIPNPNDMPRTLGEWEGAADVVQVIVTNAGTASTDDLRIALQLRGQRRGEVARTDNGSPLQPRFVLGAGETRLLLWDEAIDPNAIRIADNLENEFRRDGLPEDVYLLCGQILDDAGASVSGPETCASFLVYEPDAPTAVYPIGGEAVNPEALVFQWAPSQDARSTYLLTVKPRFAGQSVVTAMQANPVQLDVEVATGSYLYLPSDAPWDLYPDAVGYVWQVQELRDGVPAGRDDGRSPAAAFVLREQPAFGDVDRFGAPAPPPPPSPGIQFEIGARTGASPEGYAATGLATTGLVASRQSFEAERARHAPAPPARVPVTLTGSATASFDVYSQSGLTRDRRPGGALLLNGQVTATVAGLYTIPLSLYLSTEDAGYQLPFNQIGLSPTFGGWATLHGGYFSTRFSNFTLGDARLLGGGFELEPGPARIALVSGISQQATTPDEFGRLGLFRQRLTAAQLGVGSEGGYLFWLTGLHATDDTNSLDAAVRRAETVRAPQENLVVSARFATPFLPGKLELDGEVAVGAYSEDTFAQKLVDLGEYGIPGFVESAFTPRTSSRVDLAAETALRVTPVQPFSIALKGQYVGPGFQSLGAPQLEVDVLDFVVNPTLTLPKGSLNLSVGVRTNDVAGTRLFGTQRTIINATGNVRPVPWGNLSVQFSNYGLRSSTDNDTLRIENVSRLISVSPGVQYVTGTLRHAVRASYSYQEFNDENIITGRLGDTQNHSGTLSYTFAWPSGLALTTSSTLVRGLTSSINSTIFTVNQTAAYAFLNRKLRTSLSLGYNQTETVATDYGFQGRLQLGYRVGRQHRFQLTAQVRAFDYGVERAGSNGFTETLGRLAYTLSL